MGLLCEGRAEQEVFEALRGLIYTGLSMLLAVYTAGSTNEAHDLVFRLRPFASFLHASYHLNLKSPCRRFQSSDSEVPYCREGYILCLGCANDHTWHRHPPSPPISQLHTAGDDPTDATKRKRIEVFGFTSIFTSLGRGSRGR